jgi:hypothetical protein
MPEIFLPDGGVLGVGEDEQLEYEILQQAATTKIVLGVDESYEKVSAQRAFVRLVQGGSLRILDVLVLPRPNGPALCRVFDITKDGKSKMLSLGVKYKRANN